MIDRSLARLVVHVSALIVPRHQRSRWREEWLGEIEAVERRGRVLRRALGAPRDAWILRWADRPATRWSAVGWGSDLRDAWRSIRQTPVQTAAIVICLSLGSALTVMAFGIVNALVGGELPGVRDRQRLVKLGIDRAGEVGGLVMADFHALPAEVPGLTMTAAVLPWTFATRVNGEAVVTNGRFVSGTYFEVLGTEPVVGRLFDRADDRADAPPVAVIGHAFWMRHFAGADPVGAMIDVGAEPYLVIGVAPRGFTGIDFMSLESRRDERSQVFLPFSQVARGPLQLRLSFAAPMAVGPAVIGRLQPGLSRSEAERLLVSLSGRLRAAREGQPPTVEPSAVGAARSLSLRLLPASLTSASDQAELLGGVSLMMAPPLLILALACANVAGVQLVRAIRRTHDLAIRVSIGASRSRVVRLLVIETALLAAGAGILAWATATQALRLGQHLLPFAVVADARLLAFSIVLPVVVTIAAGLLPAWRATGFDVLAGLRWGARVGQYGRRRMRRAVLVTQLALSVLLLALTSAAVQFIRAAPARIGPLHTDVLVVDLRRLHDQGLGESEQRRVRDTLLARISALPGVRVAAMGDTLFSRTHSHIDGTGRAVVDPRFAAFVKDDGVHSVRRVTGGFFEAIGLRTLKGRTFGRGDHAGVAVVNASFAARLDAPDAVLGLTIRVGPPDRATTAEIIGVVEDGYERAVIEEAGEAVVYAPFDPSAAGDVTIYARGPEVETMLPAVRTLLGQIDPRLAPYALGSVADLVRDLYEPQVRAAAALGVVGLVALFLAGVGLFGAVAQSASLRTQEFGIRVALGATPLDVGRAIVRDAFVTTFAGGAAGVALAVGLLTFAGVSGVFDLLTPVALAGMATTLGLLAFVASFSPARVAMAVDPLRAINDGQ